MFWFCVWCLVFGPDSYRDWGWRLEERHSDDRMPARQLERDLMLDDVIRRNADDADDLGV